MDAKQEAARDLLVANMQRIKDLKQIGITEGAEINKLKAMNTKLMKMVRDGK